MTSKLKLKLTNIFRSPICSRRSKAVADHPFFYPQNHHHHHLIELFSPIKPPHSQPFPSICKPKSSQTEQPHFISRPKFTGDTPIFTFPATKSCRKNTPHQKKSRKARTRRYKNKKFDEFLNSVSGNYNNYWFTSSDDEDEAKDDDKTTLFSSKSLSSSGSSSEFFQKNKDKNRENVVETDEFEKGLKDSFAVVKKSSDPYNDFRTSMVEMIVERQLFGVKDLENLLQCFLSLNSTCHHMVIVEVFSEIWETLFCDWS